MERKTSFVIIPTPTATAMDVTFDPPTIPIDEDHPVGFYLNQARILATLAFPLPVQAEERQRAAAALYLWTINKRRHDIRIDPSLLALVMEGPPMNFDSLVGDINAASKRGHIAGLVLYFLLQMDRAKVQRASMGKARHCVALAKKRKPGRGGCSKATVARCWDEFKPVAHIYLALYMLKHSLTTRHKRAKASENPLILLKDRTTYRRLFALAEHYRAFGENFYLPDDRPGIHDPLFGPGEAWRADPRFDVSGVDVADDGKIFRGLKDLLKSYNPKEK